MVSSVASSETPSDGHDRHSGIPETLFGLVQPQLDQVDDAGGFLQRLISQKSSLVMVKAHLVAVGRVRCLRRLDY